MSSLARRIVDSRLFQRLVLALILFAAVLVGLETDRELVARWHGLFTVLDRVVLGLFTIEIVLRLLAAEGGPGRFFRDPWNVFDFVIVAVCLVPANSGFAAVFRLVRVLRVLRLISAVPRLQILVGALLKSVPSMGYVALLLSLHFYIYAVVGTKFFGTADPGSFGSLLRTGVTLFQVVTLEGWVDIMNVQMEGGRFWGPVLYFVSFILLGTMIMLNLLIGVIVNGMEEARQETEDDARARHVAETGQPSAADELIALERRAKELGEAIAAVRRRQAGR
jgi:voltage-gated sodium channel